MTPDERLERIRTWAEAQPDVTAVVLIGSRARTDLPADAQSDTDLLLACDEPARYLDDAGWLGEFGEPLLTFTEPTGLRGLHERRVLYTDGGDVDIVPIGSDELAESIEMAAAHGALSRGIRLLVDRERRLETLLARLERRPAPAAWPPQPGAFANAVADFWYHVLWTARKLRRGELWTAKSCLDGYLKRLLLEAVEWDALERSDGTADVWFEGRFVERWAAPGLVARLRTVFAHYDAADLERGLWATADLYDEIVAPLAERQGLPYPTDAVAEVRRRAADVLAG